MSIDLSPTDVCGSSPRLSVSSDNRVCVEPNKDLSVVAKKKEYTIIGDRLYTSFSGTPPVWLQEMMSTVMDQTINSTVDGLNDLREGLVKALDEVDVAKNTYNSSIVGFSDGITALNGRVDTLNTTVDANNATIIQTMTTMATKDYAASVAADRIESSVNEGLIGSKISVLTSSISTVNQALADSVTLLSARYDGVADAQSTLENTVSADRDKAMANFSYNASLKLNYGGQDYYYTSGFGLVTKLVGGSNEHVPAGSSEFWINADKFRFTNSNTTGTNTPFSIDATGSTPRVRFNGEVEFHNVSGTEQLLEDVEEALEGSGEAKEDVAISLGYNNYADMVSHAVAGQTVISGGLINTNLIKVGNNTLIADGVINTNLLVVKDANISGDIKSVTYSPGDSGWRFNRDGNFELNGSSLLIKGKPVTEVSSVPWVGGSSITLDVSSAGYEGVQRDSGWISVTQTSATDTGFLDSGTVSYGGLTGMDLNLTCTYEGQGAEVDGGGYLTVFAEILVESNDGSGWVSTYQNVSARVDEYRVGWNGSGNVNNTKIVSIPVDLVVASSGSQSITTSVRVSARLVYVKSYFGIVTGTATLSNFRSNAKRLIRRM